jgi:hypothetical protein
MEEMANKLIVGIHGLANKPEKEVLLKWWETSIREGLLKNENEGNPQFEYEMVYWRQFLYLNALHRNEEFYFDQLYNSEPYVEAKEGKLKVWKDSFFDAVAAKAFDLGGETLDTLKNRLGFNSLADAVLGKLLKDLHLYYEDGDIRAKLRNSLTEVLLANQGKEIMVVSHSMGSIVAYDALTLLGQTHPGFEVDYFVTIGSPLGLPHVRAKIVEEFTHRVEVKNRVRTPTVVKKRWLNYADRRDPVALDVKLSDDYSGNAGGVKCEDDLVNNDYRIKKRGEKEESRNHHKSYGYLRTPEFSKLVKEFL